MRWRDSPAPKRRRCRDTEASFAELKDRCDRTIHYLEGFDASALEGSEGREVKIIFPNGMGYRFIGSDYLAGFALPNFYFHVTPLTRSFAMPGWRSASRTSCSISGRPTSGVERAMPDIRNIVILTGAGVSAESGLATFRGPDGLWEGHRVEDVATPEAFRRDPALVHAFYDARRAKLGNGRA